MFESIVVILLALILIAVIAVAIPNWIRLFIGLRGVEEDTQDSVKVPPLFPGGVSRMIPIENIREHLLHQHEDKKESSSEEGDKKKDTSYLTDRGYL